MQVPYASSYIPNIPEYGKWIPIVTTKSTEEAATTAAVWAFKTFGDQEINARNLLVNGAVAAIKFGMCVTANNAKDGSWVVFQETDINVPTYENDVQKITNEEDVRFALKVMLATKVHWWTYQQPVMPHCMHEYLRSMLTSQYGNISEDIIAAVNIIGCWASTIKVLFLAGIPKLKEVGEPKHPAINTVSLSSTEQKKFEEMPAGTIKISLLYDAAVLLIQSPLLQLCPRAREFVAISEMKKMILSSPAEYHNAAIYLTGRPRLRSLVNSCDKYMGRLGSFILNIFPTSTLAKSPFFNIQKVQSYPDYSLAFDMALKEYVNPARRFTTVDFIKFILQSDLQIEDPPFEDTITLLEQEFGCKMERVK